MLLAKLKSYGDQACTTAEHYWSGVIEPYFLVNVTMRAAVFRARCISTLAKYLGIPYRSRLEPLLVNIRTKESVDENFGRVWGEIFANL